MPNLKEGEEMMEERFYNLIVRCDPTAPMSDDRVFEGTPDEIKAKFTRNGRYDLEALSKLPAIMTQEFVENDRSAVAVVGYMDYPSLNPIISHPVMFFESQSLMDRGVLSGWENMRTRWTVCQGDPFRLFAACAITPPVNPNVAVNPQLAAVMMPFNAEAALDNVYKAISAGSKNAGYSCKRVDELAYPADITEDIAKLIQESGVVVADISGLNPNVMFELGFSRGCGKRVVIVTSDELSRLPFDVRQQRVIRYHKTEGGLRELSKKVCMSLQAMKP